jgi:hypothetical protein
MPRAPKVEGAERDRITVLLGAGASTFAHAPTTSQLTTTLEGHPITAAILGGLRKNDETKDANFEDALYVLEELEHLCDGEERSALMLRGFADASAFLQAHNLQHTDLRLARFSIYEQIADAFNGIDYDAVWPELANFLEPFLEHFELDVFTLNYDLVADVAINALVQKTGKQYFDGFGRPITPDGTETFSSKQFALWPPPLHLTLSHIHGSLRFAYSKPDRRMAHAVPFAIAQAARPSTARDSWQAVREAVAGDTALRLQGVAPIIAGLRKAEKILVAPYANYYARFAKRVSDSPNIIIIGYGSGDAHINFWLREFALIHEQTARLVEITIETESRRFATQRYGTYDLVWERVDDDLYHPRAGIECLVFNGGFPHVRMPMHQLLRVFTAPRQQARL